MYKFKEENRDKTKLLFIHGYAATDASINAMRSLDRDFDIITINLPFSGKIKGQKLSIENYISYVNDFVDEQHLKDFVVLGHSLGGAIAMGVKGARKRILQAPLNPFATPYKKILVPQNIDDAKKSIRDLIVNYQSRWSEEYVEKTAKLHFDFTIKNEEDLDYLVNKQILNNNYLQNDLSKIYSKYSFIIIQGANDKYISLESSKKTAKHFKGDLKIIDNCGHSPIFEKPQEVVNIINKVIKNLT